MAFFLMTKKKDRQLDELRKVFDAADKDGDGKLSPAEWLSVLKDGGVDCSEEDVKAMFTERDKDRDGHLSFEEFSGQETKMERAFKSMDKDGDGFITKSEFKLVCKNLTKEQISAAFAKFDETGNGKLNYVEFCGMMNRSKNKDKDKGGGGKTLASGSSSGAPR